MKCGILIWFQSLYLFFKLMIFKGLLVILLATAVFAYQKQGNVLVLSDADFPKVIQQHDFIMIEFYAPWCGHCKKLDPIYKQVADALQAQGSQIKLAKCDSTVHTKSAATYKVQGYPTIFFFHKGEKIDYKGQRTKQYLTNWLLKKTRDPLVPADEETYNKLQTADSVSIVFHGDANSAQGKIISKLAVADDYNTYYVAQVGKPEGTLQVFRPFDSVATTQTVDQTTEAWIRANQRPVVVPFDDRTIGQMFSNSKAGVCLFNQAGSNVLLDAFTESAKNYLASGKQLIFTHLEQSSEHLGPFADYIKVKPESMAIVLIESKIKSKFVLVKNPTEVTAEDITLFLESYTSGDLKKYQITEQVKVQQEAEQL